MHTFVFPQHDGMYSFNTYFPIFIRNVILRWKNYSCTWHSE